MTRRLSLGMVRCLALFSAFQLLSISAFAQNDAAYERFRSGTLDIPTLAEVLPLLPDPEKRPVIRAAILEAKDPPRAEMAALLDHPLLSVRLGALELLEELAGGDLSYNPWTPAESPENLAALARWRAWAGEPADSSKSGSIFSEEQRRGYLRDLLADDNDKANRARRMLEAEGLSAVGFLETFLNDTPTLSPGARARIREAQYQITLARQLGDQAAVTARHLAFGSRDQLLSALATVRGAGMLAIPILRDFITHQDSLVRETAIDSLLVSAGETAVPIIAPLLAVEPDVNVIHGALRRLKDIRTAETEKLVTQFLTHPDEDLLVSAIQTSLTLSGDNDRFNSGSNKAKKSPDSDAAILKCLSDPRWRVRATALEYITKRQLLAAREKCLELLEDPDDFVRFAAIKALVAIGVSDAMPKLRAMLLESDEMIAPVIGVWTGPLDDEVLARLDAASKDIRLEVIRSISANQSLAPLTLRYAADPDLDVSCAALRQIATNENLIKQNRYASAIVAALRTGSPEKADAILERIELPDPPSGNIDPMLLESLLAGKRIEKSTALDSLYDAFLLPGAGAAGGTAGDNTEEIPAALAEIITEIGKYIAPEKQLGVRFNAALTLARAGNAEGYSALNRDLPTLTTAQKTSICNYLNSPSGREAIPLLTALLRDPVSEVRKGAAGCALSNEKAKALIDLVIGEMQTPGSPLQPDEVYGYRFEYAVRAQKALFRPWCLATLSSEEAGTPARVLAAIASRHCADNSIIAALKKLTTSADPKLRRVAWHSLIHARASELNAAAEPIAADTEAFVRAVLPDRVMKENYAWTHHFSDSRFVEDNHSDYSSYKTRLPESIKEILARLATSDPSPLIRFESAFALIHQGVPIDFDAFVTLLPGLSKDANAVRRITNWLGENASRATPALRPLLAVADTSKINADKLKILNSRINPSKTKGIITFASLAENAAATADEGKDAVLLDEETEEPPAERTSLEVIHFYKPGCAECIKARQYINSLKTDFPLVQLTEYNITDPAGLILNQALCARLAVPSLKHSVSPAVFTQSGFVIGPDVSPATLGKLFADTMETTQDDEWAKIDEPEKAAAAAAVDRGYEEITLSIVILGGLLDGINPCAFATIIFFLSYLQIARRTPREMLMVGAAFISAVFIAYLAAGLLLYEVLEALDDRFAGIQRWLNIVFGTLALIAAWLSFRDALRARAGRIDEMTLQLPGMLKDRIRGVIRSGARARNFVIAAFLSGLVISLLELACTGQVYAPIIYQIQKGRLDAVLWLVIYNLAFVTPLIIIFLLAYGGLRSETLIEFQKKHTFAVKIGLGLVFLLLAFVILFGSRVFAP